VRRGWSAAAADEALERPTPPPAPRRDRAVFAPANGRSKTHDLFHIDGTCLAGDTEQYAQVFMDIARSFRFVK